MEKEGPDPIPGIEGIQEKDLAAYQSNYGAHRVGISPAEVAEYYNQWVSSGSYEQDLNPELYRGPEYAAKTLAALFSEDERQRIRVLDVAAGTGMVGLQLSKMEFRHIDALDPAQKMLDAAQRKGIYENLVCDFIGDHATSIASNTYDAVVISGGMGEGHIPCSGMEELCRIVKAGGYVIIVMREEYLSYVEEYKEKLELCFSCMEKEGKWTLVTRTVVPNYSFRKNGVIFLLEKSMC